MISTHSLSEDAFVALAGGAGDSAVVSQLRAAQLSQHLMLLYVVARAAERVNPPSPASTAFRASYRLLAEAQAADPDTVARVLGLPHVGSWAHDCLAALDSGGQPPVTGDEARADVAVIRAVYDSARTGRPVVPVTPRC